MRKIPIVGCWLGLTLSVAVTLLATVDLFHGYVGEWENYQGQPANSGLAVIVSAVLIVVFAVSVYKLHTNPKWNGWAKSAGIYAPRILREKGHRLPPPR